MSTVTGLMRVNMQMRSTTDNIGTRVGYMAPVLMDYSVKPRTN